jgi:hypothetical protein
VAGPADRAGARAAPAPWTSGGPRPGTSVAGGEAGLTAERSEALFSGQPPALHYDGAAPMERRLKAADQASSGLGGRRGLRPEAPPPNRTERLEVFGRRSRPETVRRRRAGSRDRRETAARGAPGDRFAAATARTVARRPRLPTACPKPSRGNPRRDAFARPQDVTVRGEPP